MQLQGLHKVVVMVVAMVMVVMMWEMVLLKIRPLGLNPDLNLTLVIGNLTFVISNWSIDIGYWSSDIGNWTLVIGNLSLFSFEKFSVCGGVRVASLIIVLLQVLSLKNLNMSVECWNWTGTGPGALNFWTTVLLDSNLENAVMLFPFIVENLVLLILY